MIPSGHFRQRVAERIGPDMCPHYLCEAIAWAIRDGRDDLVKYVGRVKDRGVRMFRFRCAMNGENYLIVVESDLSNAVTVMPDDGRETTHPKADIAPFD